MKISDHCFNAIRDSISLYFVACDMRNLLFVTYYELHEIC